MDADETVSLNLALSHPHLKAALAALLPADRLIETSCALIILKGAHAYKFKKSVDYGFLDFTSVDKRRKALQRELELNVVTAPDIYLGLDSTGDEPVLIMRRFDTQAVLSQAKGAGLDLDMMRCLGGTIGLFHAKADVCHDRYHHDNIDYIVQSNQKNIHLFHSDLGEAAVLTYDTALKAALLEQQKLIEARFSSGFVRRCHGDLHLGNILIEHNQPILFDCIEFNERLSQIDVLYDLAFLLMDLWVRDAMAAANRVMNAWLEAMARHLDPIAVYSGLKLLPLYMSIRAAVRCHVCAHQGEMDTARAYLQAACAFLELTAEASLTAIGGLSGSGKSTLARKLAPAKVRAPGAVILRSDVIRKTLWGVEELAALPQAAYSPHENERVYAHMFDLAKAGLNAGQCVILDASFREPIYASRAKAIADLADAPFFGLWLVIDDKLRLNRVRARAMDASDASLEVAAAQSNLTVPDGWFNYSDSSD
jgi:uncharacterized protein